MVDHIFQAGAPRDRASIQLATKQGTYIPNERRREGAPDTLRAAVDLYVRERPNAQLRSISATYNCVGLVFATRRTWVDPDHLPMILREDGYSRVPNLERVRAGDVIIYRNDKGETVHIALVFTIEPEVATATWRLTALSKWGANGEYMHTPEHVPHVYGRPSEYWSERRAVP